MAVPKKKRSKALCRRRQKIVFYDRLDGLFIPRKENFYRSLYDPPYIPRDAYKTDSVPTSINRPFRFPGFWPGRFAYHKAATLLGYALKK